MAVKQGSLVCVGPGMVLGAHMSERCRNHISQADVVFSSCHPVIEQWISTMNPDVRSLQGLYGKDKDRGQTYSEMQAALMQAVRDGCRVVGVFYGHPGVFAQVPHAAIQQAREEGFEAWMEPGISADACLFADMGIDPGAFGCQSFETSQFMFYKRAIDPTAYLILWQLGHAGDLSMTPRQTGPQQRTVLMNMLLEHYAPEHNIAIYESPFLPTQRPKINWFPLQELPDADVSLISTLVIPPGKKLTPNHAIITQLKSISGAQHGKKTDRQYKPVWILKVQQ